MPNGLPVNSAAASPGQTFSSRARLPASRPAKIRRWNPHRNDAGTMIGVLSVELPSGLIINDAKLMVGPAGKHWIALPAIKQIDRDGTPKLDENGKPLWSPVVEISNRHTRERFNEMVLDAVRRQHPEALNDDAAPPPRQISAATRSPRYVAKQMPRSQAQLPNDRVDDLWTEPHLARAPPT
jgi:hypothetical protein